MNSPESSIVEIVPLRKKWADGAPYVRRDAVLTKLRTILLLSVDEVITRCVVSDPQDPNYLPSECLVYLLRNRSTDDRFAVYETVYRVLMGRVLSTLPAADSTKGRTIGETTVREQVFDEIVSLLAQDRTVYCEKLDYFECYFDSALKRRRQDAYRALKRQKKDEVRLEIDEETGDLPSHIEKAAKNFNPFEPSKLDDPVYRSRLDAAIDSLPDLERRIIQMRRQGMIFSSPDPTKTTIAKVLRRSDKSVRTYEKMACAALCAKLEEDGP